MNVSMIVFLILVFDEDRLYHIPLRVNEIIADDHQLVLNPIIIHFTIVHKKIRIFLLYSDCP